jgi:predicted metal-dependent hydrolase
MQAFRSNGLIEIHIPARMSRKEEALVIPQMIELVRTREAKQRRSDSELVEWADQMLIAQLPEITVKPASINWRPMRDRWGSCTTVDRTIRISHRLALAPEYVIRYVLFHELIHLAIPGHGDDFYALLGRFEKSELAEAFLEGYEAGAQGAPEEIFLTGPEDLIP